MGTITAVLRALVLAGATAGCADDLYAMDERYEIKGGEREFAGGGCMLVISGGPRAGSSASGGGTTDPGRDFAVSEQTQDDALVVVVHSRTTELASRKYGEKFLSSGKRDEFSVTTLAGRTFELAYWGGHECDTSHLPPDR